MKKVLSIVLVICLCATTAFASFGSPNVSSEKAIRVSDASLLEKIFSPIGTSEVEANTLNSNLDYVYNITYGNDLESADVELEFSLYQQVIEVSGNIPVIALADGTYYVEGPLYGTTTLNGEEYNVIVGFQTIKDCPDIGASVTIYQYACANAAPLYMYFGEFEKTEAIYAWEESETNYIEEDSTIETNSVTSTSSTDLQLTTIRTGTSNFDPTTGQGGMTSAPQSQKLVLSFDPNKRVAIVELNTYTSNINRNTFTIDVPLNVTVYESTITFNNVTEGAGAADASVSRFYNLNDLEEYTASNSVIRELFIALLTYIASVKGIPTSTLSLFIPDARGSVTADIDADGQAAAFSIEITNNSESNNFDDVALPVSFVVESLEDGNFRFQGSADTIYRVACVIGTYYVPSSTVTASGTLPIRM